MRIQPLNHFNDRPSGLAIDTIVIHSMYDPSHSDELCHDAASCIKLLDSNKVAAHYAVARDGTVFRLVEESKRAWHAGQSKMPFADDSRENVNDFSIGIELICSEASLCTAEQYDGLVTLTLDIFSRHPIKNIVGHDQIAPGRKTDPGPCFNWNKFKDLLRQKNKSSTIRFL